MSAVRVNVYLTLESTEFASAFGSDDSELESALRARLTEFYGDDGSVIVPNVLGIDVEEDEPMTIDERIALAQSEIRADVARGVVPVEVASFAELHDFVDANEYGGLFDMSGDQFSADVANTLQNALDAWIKSGGLS